MFGQNLTDGAVTQTYDGLGRIATRNSVGFTYTGTSLDPTGDGTWTVNHSMLAGEVLSVKTGSTARWGVSDTHRNLVALNVPSSGAVDNTTRYTPFGETAARTGTLSPTVGFQGDYTDPTTSNVWMGARHYTPSTATFTSRDSYSGRLEQPISLNRYTYAHNNPLNLWDPAGYAATDASKATLSKYLKTVDVNKYKANNDLRGYLLAVDAANQSYRTHEFGNLVRLLGVDGAIAHAGQYAGEVVDPTIAWGRDVAALAWATAKPQSGKTATTRPSGRAIPKANMCARSTISDISSKSVQNAWTNPSSVEKWRTSKCDPVALLTWLDMEQAEKDWLATCARNQALNNATNIGLDYMSTCLPIFKTWSLPGGRFDPKVQQAAWFQGSNSMYVDANGNSLNVVDLGHPDYLYYFDVLGNVTWGAIARLVIPDRNVDFWTDLFSDSWIVQQTNNSDAGLTDSGDNISVMMGLELGRKYGDDLSFRVLTRYIVDNTSRYVSNARSRGLPITYQNLSETKLVKRADVRLR